MGLIKKPSDLDPKYNLAALIYGQPGIGKTTLALSAPEPVLFDFDGGVHRVNGAHQVDTVQPRAWEDVTEALEEVRNAAYKTIVVDTIGKMMVVIEAYIKRVEPKFVQRDGTLNLKGYGRRKVLFVEFIKTVLGMGKNVVFVAHQVEDRRGDETVIRPETGGKAGDELMKELDLVGYMQAIGSVRTIDFDPSERYYAKNACNMRAHDAEGNAVPITLPVVVNDAGVASENTFMSQVVAMCVKRQQEARQLTARYEALLAEGAEKIAAIAGAEDANAVLAWVLGAEQVYNSQARLKMMLHKAATDAGLTYNKSGKCYE